jgi:putative hydrolase of the HAD superfamily
MTNLNRWLIFDADNTLWDLESLYDQARVEFCKYVAEQIAEPTSKITTEILDRSQRHRDIQLKRTHGYSASRFARSFEDTATFFFPFADPEQIIRVRNIALNVFETVAKPVDGLKEVIESLEGHYRLAVITAGERWVQERRLTEFHFREKFSQILVVERKTAAILNDFCAQIAANKEKSWMIGDSIVSDIQPAIEAGLNAIHVNTANWEAEAGTKPKGITSVESLGEIVPLLIPR